MAQHEVRQGRGVVGRGGAHDAEHARALHHLATADPEPERDGPLTSAQHEKKYGLERGLFWEEPEPEGKDKGKRAGASDESKA